VNESRDYDEQVIKFAKYLIIQGKLDDAKYALKTAKIKKQDQQYANLLMATIHYRQKKYDSAQLVLSGSDKTIATNRWLMNQLALRTKGKLNGKYPENNTSDIIALQYLAHYALSAKVDSFRLLMDVFKFENDTLESAEFMLFLKASSYKKRIKHKKPWLAGAMSTILPGSGRIYAGKSREALTSFIPIATLGAQVAEGLWKPGLPNAHFYVFAPIAAVFYASNIYGSARAAKRTNAESLQEFNNEIFQIIDPIILGRL